MPTLKSQKPSSSSPQDPTPGPIFTIVPSNSELLHPGWKSRVQLAAKSAPKDRQEVGFENRKVKGINKLNDVKINQQDKAVEPRNKEPEDRPSSGPGRVDKINLSQEEVYLAYNQQAATLEARGWRMGGDGKWRRG